jgi:hypothetical protein
MLLPIPCNAGGGASGSENREDASHDVNRRPRGTYVALRRVNLNLKDESYDSDLDFDGTAVRQALKM